jgi:hypothetical protein
MRGGVNHLQAAGQRQESGLTNTMHLSDIDYALFIPHRLFTTPLLHPVTRVHHRHGDLSQGNTYEEKKGR